jgi:3-oxoacyl-[acyl-carrier protein] reductase
MKKNILILGASSDIGVELIKLLLKNEFNITAHCFTNSKILSRISKKNNKLLIVQKDLNKLNDKNIKNFCKKNFNNKFGAYVNLIGYTDNKSFKNTSIDSFLKSISVNALIPMLILRHILKKMLKNKYGRILNGSSIGVKFGGGENSFNYSVSKHILEFIPSIIKKSANKNIVMNNLRIGVTNTKIHSRLKRNKMIINKRISNIPSKRMASKIEIAEYIYFLISEKNSFMTNETITVAGGE